MMPKLLSIVSSLCQSGGLYTSTAGVSISTRVEIDESLEMEIKKGGQIQFITFILKFHSWQNQNEILIRIKKNCNGIFLDWNIIVY